jgi:nitrous oxide reductase
VRWSIVLGMLVLALSACGGTDENGNVPNAATTADTTEAAPTTSEATTTEAAPEGPRQIRIAYRSGELSGDTGTVRVAKGDRIRLIVRADVEEEVHVHGYDLSAAVAPQHPARIDFIADQPGTFTIELEQLQLHILRLRVGS